MNIRALRANEVEARVARVTAKGCMLLIYKDARCDMNILDETFGSLYWKREHTRDNANCVVSVWNKDLKQWISKEDTGTQSFTEKEKGLASDSFKRACFNFGIGRELYTAPFIWFSMKTEKDGSKYRLAYGISFEVTKMTVKDGVIIELEIKSNKGDKFYYKEKGMYKNEEAESEPVQETIEQKEPNDTNFRKQVTYMASTKDKQKVVVELLGLLKIEKLEQVKERRAFINTLESKLSKL